MNDIIFYWSAWACWIWSTWIMDKGKSRTQIATFSLLAIICSNYTFTIARYTVNLTIIFFLLLSVYFILKNRLAQQFYLFFISTVAAFGYAAIYLLSIFDPVLFLLPVNGMTTIFSLVIASLVASRFIDKLFVIFFSITLGEIVIGITFEQLNLNDTIGMNQYLTRITLPFLIVSFLTTIKTFILKKSFV